ncbi:MAG: CBS domain-containing protein [Phycisphaeraceae bacterium]|nr:MAG: CBS domain-containing protein [Phycisphaeraceae bacterium]
MAIVSDIMTRGVFTVKMDDTIRDIRHIFMQRKFHHVIVVSGGKAVGVISDRDLLKTISPFIGSMSERPQDLNTLNKKAHQVMTRDLVFVHENSRIIDAARLMVSCRVSCLPVLTDEGVVRGIVTWRDILTRIVDEDNEANTSRSAA